MTFYNYFVANVESVLRVFLPTFQRAATSATINTEWVQKVQHRTHVNANVKGDLTSWRLHGALRMHCCTQVK